MSDLSNFSYLDLLNVSFVDIYSIYTQQGT